MFGNKTKPSSSAPQASVPKPAPQPAVKQEAEEDDMDSTNYIASGTVIEGNITSADDLQIDGTVKGDIKTTSRLLLGEDSIVEGNIVAAEADVSGTIKGTVASKGQLTIRSTCVIDGDIVTKSLNVESGSSFNGRCQVGGGASASPVRSAQSGTVASKGATAAPVSPTKKDVSTSAK